MLWPSGVAGLVSLLALLLVALLLVALHSALLLPPSCYSLVAVESAGVVRLHERPHRTPRGPVEDGEACLEVLLDQPNASLMPT